MKVKNLISYLGVNYDKNLDVEISEIVTDLKDVSLNCVLICIKGRHFDIEENLNDSIINKCALILSNKINSKFIYIKDLKSKCFNILDYFYFNFKHDFKIICITGTEGKSSLSNIIYQGLTKASYKCLVIATSVLNKDFFKSELTTPTSFEFIKAMQKALDYDFLICEISSIGIEEKRVDLSIFDYIFLTNLNVDHLDYHQTVFNYHYAKIKLFLENKKAKKFIFNDAYLMYKELFDKVNNLTIIKNDDIKYKINSLIKQDFVYKNIPYSSNLLFKQNIMNNVFLIELLTNLAIKNISKIISSLRKVKGRLDIVNSKPCIMIDYAHSYKSLELLLKQVKELNYKRIIVVIGAGGDRDASKRKLYGKVLEQYADFAILTDDNPRNEDELKIINDIISNNKFKYNIILNRKMAIEYAITIIDDFDILLVIGRGNEEYQIIKGKKVELNDYKIIKNYLMENKYGN